MACVASNFRKYMDREPTPPSEVNRVAKFLSLMDAGGSQ